MVGPEWLGRLFRGDEGQEASAISAPLGSPRPQELAVKLRQIVSLAQAMVRAWCRKVTGAGAYAAATASPIGVDIPSRLLNVPRAAMAAA